MDIHSPKKRLAIFLPELLGGGAQRVMLNLAQGIVDNGYSVDFNCVKGYRTLSSRSTQEYSSGQFKITWGGREFTCVVTLCI